MDPIDFVLHTYGPVFKTFFLLSIFLIALAAVSAADDKAHRRKQRPEPPDRGKPSASWSSIDEENKPKPEPAKISLPALNCPFCGAAYAVLAPTCSQCGAPRKSESKES